MPNPMDPNLLRELLRITAMRESGNKDFRPNGQPVTSPAGAMYRMQVLPSTARDPGFGVQPAAAQTPAEYNRVGEQYFGKMLGRYGNDPGKAWAAYHSGAGTVDRLQRAYGPAWQQHLGPAGRQYVSQNLAAIPRTQPQAPVPNPPIAQAPAMASPSPLDAAAGVPPSASATPDLQPGAELANLYRQRQENEDKQIALMRTKADIATQALNAKRRGVGAGDWFRLSAALASRTNSRGLGGVLENVSPVLADIADRNEKTRTGREQALAQIGYDRQKGELDTRAAGFDSRLQMLKTMAERNQPDKLHRSFNPVTGELVDTDTGTTVDIQPQVGAIRVFKGVPYRYKGGNQYDRNSWEPKR